MAKILLTDDDEMSLMVSEMILSEAGHDVITAGSGEECIGSLKVTDFDLLLLDIEMMDMSGIEVLDTIRKTEGISDIRTIFLTASAQLSESMEAFRLGALGMVQKPADPDELLASVDDALSFVSKKKILAVDDEPMNLMATEEIFGIRYDVVCAEDGEKALDIIKSDRPDLVLLDLHMPKMDGLEVLKRIRYIEGCKELPVIFLTADDDADTEAKLMSEGAMDFIAKPFVMNVALQRISHALQLSDLKNSLEEEVARKTDALRIKNEQVKNLSEQIILALAGAIDVKDSYTNGHSNRVADYSKEIAKRLGKSQREQNDIYNIALLHDVGKVSIPLTILNKPGKLTDEEFELIKSHTVKGYEILKNISEMPELSIGARWHHERYDGKGYPDGKKGEDIPEIARIICVADCYDAMSSDRSYRIALPQDVARSEIEKGMGTQFDPEIARVMLEMIDEDTEYAMNGSKKPVKTGGSD